MKLRLSPLGSAEALRLADAPLEALPELCAAAREVRDHAWGRRITFSPKVFLPVTNLCKNRCSYCSFRRSPSQPGAHTMPPREIVAWLDRARDAGCAEALLCLGDKPEAVFPSYRDELASWGHASTVDYLVEAAELALERALLPHTNAGLLTASDMARLKRVNVSLGLMLETASARLGERGMPHEAAPDKRPEPRIRMIDEAGALGIPFTTGILVGIGETPRERVEALLAIRDLHRRHGHVQEVIVQPFRPHPSTPMRDHAAPDDATLAHAIAMARLVLDDDVSLQAPPNLAPGALDAMLDAGINDLGGISPVSPDYINPRHPWPHLDALADACAARGFTLAPRAAVYDRFVPDAIDPALVDPVARVAARLAGVRRPADLAAIERRAS